MIHFREIYLNGKSVFAKSKISRAWGSGSWCPDLSYGCWTKANNYNLRAYLRKTVSQKANLTNISTFYNYFNQLQNISEFSAGELFCDWLKLLLKGRKLHHVGFLADWRTRVRRSRHLRWKLVGFTVYTPFSKLDSFVPSSNKWPLKIVRIYCAANLSRLPNKCKGSLFVSRFFFPISSGTN